MHGCDQAVFAIQVSHNSASIAALHILWSVLLLSIDLQSNSHHCNFYLGLYVTRNNYESTFALEERIMSGER